MAIDPKKRAEFEAKWLAQQNLRVPLADAAAQRMPEFVSAKVGRVGDYVYLALIAEQAGPTKVVGIKLNAVAAMTIATAILESVKPLFPDDLTIEAKSVPRPEDQH